MYSFISLFRGSAWLKKWSATIVANAVSIYALDTVSTVAGVLLVASGLLAGIGPLSAAMLLGASYVLWAAGLSSSLSANWRLLEATGTSTSLLSKLAYDLFPIERVSIRRFLTASGYLLFEIVKELPYYLAVFGVVLVSATFSVEEALIFLAGANVGAASYEYGLAWSTRALLQGPQQGEYASFEQIFWAPATHLAEYYREVDMDEQHTIGFFVDGSSRMPSDQPALVFGVGPTLHHVFPLALGASEIHLGDYLPRNLDEISRWISRDESAHDWQPFVRHTLKCEGIEMPSCRDVFDRQELARKKITALMAIDMRDDRALLDLEWRYATVLSAYCADSATADLGEWQAYMRRIIRLVRPGGTFLLAALGGTRSYLVGGKTFPSPALEAAHVERILLDAFPQNATIIKNVFVPECAPHGYTRIILAAGHARRADLA